MLLSVASVQAWPWPFHASQPEVTASDHAVGVTNAPKGRVRTGLTLANGAKHEELMVPDSWRGYRAGDVVRFQDYLTFPHGCNGERVRFLREQRDHFPGSFGSQYVKRAAASLDWRVSVEELHNISVPAEHRLLFQHAEDGAVVVVHLRIGDSKGSHNAMYDYVYQPHEYNPIALDLARQRHKQVVLVGGIWQPEVLRARVGISDLSANHRYIREVADVFRSHGHHVQTHFASSPDLDLKLFYIARYFIPAKWSGFSMIVTSSKSYRRPTLLQSS